MCTFYFQIWKALGYGMGFDMFVTESGFPKASGYPISFVPQETLSIPLSV